LEVLEGMLDGLALVPTLCGKLIKHKLPSLSKLRVQSFAESFKTVAVTLEFVIAVCSEEIAVTPQIDGETN